ncbi:dTMP kinase [Rhodoligotrophos defluvii]|uniref:dTMP kinase n=1 Tax=Rhodoligotrophos defluvii TaxID=2561934 RepID=UPI0010C9E8EC|nr:dTMP kinase [Rhodoligotrophos defluvii]
MAHRRFITLEGGEGTGKSTQARRLAERLRQETGSEVVLTREPGGTEGAEAIRTLLVNGRADRWSATAEALLNYAARDDHLRRIILPALERGAFVVCDRFADSTRAYQGAAGGADPALIAALERSVIGDHWPGLTLVLDIAPALGLARAANRRGGEGRFEGKHLSYHETLRRAFLATAEADPHRCVVIDAAAPLEAVTAAIWQTVASRLLA